MMGNCGITESGNTIPLGAPGLPSALSAMDTEQPGGFQLALEQVTLSQEMPANAETPIELTVVAETLETPKASTPRETKPPMEEKGEDEEVPMPDASLSTLPLMISAPAPGSPPETVEQVATAETRTMAETEATPLLPHTTAPMAHTPTEPMSLLEPIVHNQSQELTEALELLAPVSEADSQELDLDALAPQPERHVVSSEAPRTSVPPVTAPL